MAKGNTNRRTRPGRKTRPTRKTPPKSAPAPAEQASAEEATRRIEKLERTNRVLQQQLTAIDAIRMNLAQMSERLHIVTRLTHEINTLDLKKITEVAVHQIPHLVDARYASLFLYNPSRDELVLEGHNHPEPINRKVTVSRHENTIMGLAVSQRHLVYIRDIDQYEETRGARFERTFADKYATRSCICAPLMAGKKLIGVYNLADKTDGESFHEINDLPAVEQLSQMIGVAIQNYFSMRKLENEARTDGLTKLENHRAFYEVLRREIHRTVRYSHPLSLIMGDLDNLKRINDSFGHTTGDRVLAELAGIIQRYVRREDVVARYGGDEITILLPETDLTGAGAVAQRILELIHRHDFRLPDPKLTVSMSFGVAMFSPNMTHKEFVEAADTALYRAKQGGKNQVAT